MHADSRGNTQPVKVLYLISGLHAGGKERRLVELLKYQSANGDVAMDLGLMSREIRYPAVLELPVKIHYLLRRSRRDPRIFLALHRLCTSRKPDLIHTWDSMTAVYAAPVARLLHIPLLNGMVIDAPRYVRPMSGAWMRARFSFCFSDLIAANSHAGIRAYNIPMNRGVCVHNGFDFQRLRNLKEPAEVRRAFGISSRFVVGMVGAFARRKDYVTFVRAAERVLAVRNDVTFIAVGDGETLPEIRARVSELCRTKILFTGWQPEVESIMQACDIGVLATNADLHGEGIPNSVLEFMAVGRPVIATDAGGTRELLDDGRTGWLVANGNDASMAEKILALLDDPAKAHEMGECARERVRSEFSIEAMAREYRKLYERLLMDGKKPVEAA